MDAAQIDLNLLVVFDAIARHGSVTLAAESLGRSQPATSAALARLRALFDDPLFVKAGSRMQPTLRAAQLMPIVRQLLDTVRDDVLQARRFDPATSERRFKLLMPDIGEVNFLPPLIALLARQAPGVRLHARSMPRAEAGVALDLGEVDLALGYYPDLQRDGLYRQRLLRTDHVCIVRPGHPRIGATLSLRHFLDASHVVVRPDGRTHVFEQFLAGRGLARRVALEVSHFTSLEPLIAGSDLVATVPRALGEAWAVRGTVRALPVPMKLPSVEVHQFWHPRAHKDEAHAWLRSQLHMLFAEPATSGSGRRAPASAR